MGGCPAQPQPRLRTRGLRKGTAGMSPCRSILWDQGAVEPPLSLTGGTSGEEEKGTWFPQALGRPRWDWEARAEVTQPPGDGPR